MISTGVVNIVYIVDDEKNILDLLALSLQNEGIDCQTFLRGDDFLQAVRKKKPDVAIIDWMMPPPDGKSLCMTLREDKQLRDIHIILLTARAGEMDKVSGLRFGADDYVTKPFSVRELRARVEAALRKQSYQKLIQNQKYCRGNLRLDYERRIVEKNGALIDLTPREFDLLEILLRHQGQVLTRDRLLEGVWGAEYNGDWRTIDVHIRYLRQKLEDEPEHPCLIRTVRGVGYCIDEMEK